MDGAPAPDALRELVREVLRDVLPALAGQNGSGSFASSTPTPTMHVSAPSGPRAASSELPAGGRRSPAVPPTPPTSDPPPSPRAGVEGVPGAAGVNKVPGAAGVNRVPGAAGLPEAFGGRPGGAYQTASEPGVTLQPVRLVTDEDLREFALQIVRLADNPKRRRDLVAGRLRFTLGAAGHGPASAGHGPVLPGHGPALPGHGPALPGHGSASPGHGPALPGHGPALLGPGPAHVRADGRTTPVAGGGGRAGTSGGDHRIERGAVTERAVQTAASAGARLVLGPRAVLTPLARDRARALGVPIEKER
jgi:hypothetical protein